MAIIIKPEDIYDISDRKILVNNNVEGVTIQEKIIKLGNTELKTEEVNTNSTFEDMSSNMAGNIFGIDAIRVEASYSSGSITLNKNLAFDKKNVQWVVTGSYTGEDRALCNVDVSTESYSVFRTSNTERFGSIAYFLDQPIKSFQQTGLWGENGKIVSFLYNANINVTYQDESAITITETENNYVITYKILTKLAFVGAHFASVSSTSGTNGKGIIYVGEKIYFNIAVNSATISDEQSAYTVGDITTGATIALNSNSLFQKDTKIGDDTIAEVNGQTIISDWKDGKESMTLDVMVGEYYDEADDLTISTQDNALPMTFNINDEVIPYITMPVEHTSGGETYYEFEDRPIAVLSNGLAKRFNVVGIELINDGSVMQRLKLSQGVDVFKILATGGATITRTSSPSGGSTGVLTTSDVLYENDVITVAYTGGIRTWSISMGGEIIVSGSDASSISEQLTIVGDLRVSIIEKQWRWVDYGSENVYQSKEFTEQSASSWNYAASGIYIGIIPSNNKQWHFRITYIRKAFNDEVTSRWYTMSWDDDFNSDYTSGKGVAFGLDNQEYPEIHLGEPYGKNGIAISVTANDTLSFQNTGYNVGGYANYIKQVDYWVSQYEYS